MSKTKWIIGGAATVGVLAAVIVPTVAVVYYGWDPMGESKKSSGGNNKPVDPKNPVNPTDPKNPVKPDPVKPDPVKPDPVKPDPVKPEPVKPEPVKPEPVKPVVTPEKLKSEFQAGVHKLLDSEAIEINPKPYSFDVKKHRHQEDKILFPKLLVIDKSEDNTKLLPLNKGKRLVKEAYKVKYFGGDGEITDFNDVDLDNGDKVVVNIYDASDKFVSGRLFNVFSIGDNKFGKQSANIRPQEPTGLDSGEFSKKLLTGEAKPVDMFKFLNKLEWNQSYKASESLLGVPSTKSYTKKAEGYNPSNYDWKNHFYAPFVDIEQGLGGWDSNGNGFNFDNIAKISNLWKYKLLSIGFLTGGPDKGAKFASTTDQGAYKTLINSIRKQGNDVVVSLGGVANDDPWKNADPILFAKQLEGIVKGLHLKRIDFDIEASKLLNEKDVKTAALGLAIVQQKLEYEYKMEMKKPADQRDPEIMAHPYLDFTFTLPSEYGGLDGNGSKAMNIFAQSGVRISTLNGMTMMMNTGEVTKNGMVETIKGALKGFKNSIQSAYAVAGTNITDEQAYSMVGTTIDIASDTHEAERLTKDELEKIKDYAVKRKIGMLSYWHVNADDDEFDSKTQSGAGNKFRPREAYEVYSKFDDAFGDEDKRTAIDLPQAGEHLVSSLYDFYDINTENFIVPPTTTDGPGTTALSKLRWVMSETSGTSAALDVKAFRLAGSEDTEGQLKPKKHLSISNKINKMIAATRTPQKDKVSWNELQKKDDQDLNYSNIYSLDTLYNRFPGTGIRYRIVQGTLVWYDDRLFKTRFWMENSDDLKKYLENHDKNVSDPGATIYLDEILLKDVTEV